MKQVSEILDEDTPLKDPSLIVKETPNFMNTIFVSNNDSASKSPKKIQKDGSYDPVIEEAEHFTLANT